MFEEFNHISTINDNNFKFLHILLVWGYLSIIYAYVYYV